MRNSHAEFVLKEVQKGTLLSSVVFPMSSLCSVYEQMMIRDFICIMFVLITSLGLFQGDI